jgi:hypothetical protein
VIIMIIVVHIHVRHVLRKALWEWARAKQQNIFSDHIELGCGLPSLTIGGKKTHVFWHCICAVGKKKASENGSAELFFFFPLSGFWCAAIP